MTTWKIVAVATQAISLPVTGQIGNEIETWTHVHSATLWGALAKRAIQLGLVSGPAHNDEGFRRAFLLGGVRATDLRATRVVGGVIPSGAPLRSWLTSKVDAGFAADSRAGVVDCIPQLFAGGSTAYDSDDTRMAPMQGAAYVVSRMDTHHLHFGAVQTTTMNATRSAYDADTGTTKHGQLFSRSEVARGTVFVGYLSGTQECFDWLAPLFGEANRCDLKVGSNRSTSGGLSLARFETTDSVHQCWRTMSFEERWQRALDREYVDITFQTDAILVDAFGRPVNEITASNFSACFGGQPLAQLGLDPLAGCISTRRVDSFDGAVGLPRASDIAIESGSVIRLAMPADEPARNALRSMLCAAEAHGVGLRREAGFGWVIAADPLVGAVRQLSWDATAKQRVVANSAVVASPVVSSIDLARDPAGSWLEDWLEQPQWQRTPRVVSLPAGLPDRLADAARQSRGAEGGVSRLLDSVAGLPMETQRGLTDAVVLLRRPKAMRGKRGKSTTPVADFLHATADALEAETQPTRRKGLLRAVLDSWNQALHERGTKTERRQQ